MSDRGAALAAEAQRFDEADELAAKRAEFVLDDVVYLDGNSLGALPAGVSARLADVVAHEWGALRIRSWQQAGWWTAPERVGERIAPLVGAAPGQVVVGDATSVNVFKAVVAAIRLAREEDGPAESPKPNEGAHTGGSTRRDELLVDEATFPTDGYIAASAARLTGVRVRAVPAERIGEAAGPRTAAALVNHVDYRTGALHDLAGITAAVRRAGGRTVWDLCHSVGALPVQLDANGVDFAVGCTYKFLNGGPGAPAFLYVRRALQPRFDSPLPGWNSHAAPFAMAAEYTPAEGAARGRVGTPDILSMLALEEALRVFDGVEIAAVRAKSLALTDFFLRCLAVHLPATRAEVLTPLPHARRGSQISLAWRPAEEAERTLQLLGERGVVADFRPPGVLRFGCAALYTSFGDTERAARVLGEVAGGSVE